MNTGLAAAGAVAGSDDTIVAEATAAGRGAVSLIRISGRSSHVIARGLVRRWPDAPRRATLSELRDQHGVLLDNAVVVRYDSPSSFTGEDAVEIMTHGGTVVPATVVAALIELGARQAEPGEFTRRAVLNGKIDLLQAEGIDDLVSATSRAAQQLALGQLDGGLSRRLITLREELLALEALIAYDIDFPEEDDGPISTERILEATDALIASLGSLVASADSGEIVRAGALVVLAGVPNAGKSSLFNALLGQKRAIVTDIPGTTRDAIEAVVDIGRWPLRLVDTAGLRETGDLVERLGVDVSFEYLRRAEIVLACGSTPDEINQAVEACAGRTTGAVVPVHTKSDLAAGPCDSDVLAVSAMTGSQVDLLSERISDILDGRVGTITSDAPVLTRARHRALVARAKGELDEFRSSWLLDQVPAVIAAVHLRTATVSLEEMIGRVDVEQILDEVFSRFCVGK